MSNGVTLITDPREIWIQEHGKTTSYLQEKDVHHLLRDECIFMDAELSSNLLWLAVICCNRLKDTYMLVVMQLGVLTTLQHYSISDDNKMKPLKFSENGTTLCCRDVCLSLTIENKWKLVHSLEAEENLDSSPPAPSWDDVVANCRTEFDPTRDVAREMLNAHRRMSCGSADKRVKKYVHCNNTKTFYLLGQVTLTNEGKKKLTEKYGKDTLARLERLQQFSKLINTSGFSDLLQATYCNNKASIQHSPTTA